MSTFNDVDRNTNNASKDEIKSNHIASMQHEDVKFCSLSYSEKSVKELISQVIGYFDVEDDSSIDSRDRDTDDSIDAFNRFRSDQERHECKPNESCDDILYFSEDSVLTPNQLLKELEWELNRAGGRLSLTQFRLSLSLENSDGVRECNFAANQLISNLNLQKVSSSSTGDVELLSSQYWETWIEKEMKVQLKQDGGRLSISKLSAEKKLPPNLIISYLKDYKSNDNLFTVCVLGGGSTYVVSIDYLATQQKEIFQILSTVSAPTDLNDLIRKMEWNKSRSMKYVLELCQSQRLNGTLNNTSYIPDAYVKKQRQLVYNFFSTNGYITMGQCRSMISLSSYSEVKEYLNESKSNASLIISFETIFVDHDLIIAPLKTAVQKCLCAKSFVDLKMVLPETLTSSSDYHDECVNLIENIFSNNTDGVVVASSSHIMFYSNEMIQFIKNNIMPEVIENHARVISATINNVPDIQTAKMTAETCDGELILNAAKDRTKSKLVLNERDRKGVRDSNYKKLSARERRRKKKELSSSPIFDRSQYTPPYVSLIEVADKIAQEYPELLTLQNNFKKLILDKKSLGPPSWQENDESDTLESCNDGPLFSFCRSVFDSPLLRKSCFDAVQDTISKTLVSKREAAQKKRTIENSFKNELCFGTACYMIQLLSKLPRMLMNEKSSLKLASSSLEDDFLHGVGSLFARKITEYSLFQHELLDKNLFHFQTRQKSKEVSTKYDSSSNLPSFCNLFDTSQKIYEGSFLSCVCDVNNDESLDPLKLLREKLPGKVGVDLARMWTLCGGECFQGGRRKSEDGKEFTVKGKFTLFLKHIREYCKSMCGLEFKKIEKKSEKQLLFIRRQKLSQALEKSTDPEEIFDISVMLLFQKVKGIVVAGNELRRIVLDCLFEEKIIPDPVKKHFRQMADSLDKKNEIPSALAENIKKYGLTHDISLISIES